jgi:hypothetical protein
MLPQNFINQKLLKTALHAFYLQRCIKVAALLRTTDFKMENLHTQKLQLSTQRNMLSTSNNSR